MLFRNPMQVLGCRLSLYHEGRWGIRNAGVFRVAQDPGFKCHPTLPSARSAAPPEQLWYPLQAPHPLSLAGKAASAFLFENC